MSSKRTAIVKTAAGNRVTRNPARIEFAAEAMRTMTYTKAREAISRRWGIHTRTAEDDLTAARRLIAKEMHGMEVRASEVRRNERIADCAEEHAIELAIAARESKDPRDWQAVAACHKTAIAASREVSRLTGAYAPKEIKVTHDGQIEIPLRIDAVLSILDDAGLAALELVNAQIESARAAGLLSAGPEEDVEDAEIVEPDRPGEN